MTEPVLQAALEILDEELDAIRAVIAAVSIEELGWRPPAEDTNTIAVLVTHSMSSTRWWLSVAAGAEMPDRDRASEFLATASSAGDLLSFFDQMAGECRGLLSPDGEFEPGAEWVRPDGGEVVSRAWALIHALEHLREHVAQTQLTHQLWEAGRSDVSSP